MIVIEKLSHLKVEAFPLDTVSNLEKMSRIEQKDLKIFFKSLKMSVSKLKNTSIYCFNEKDNFTEKSNNFYVKIFLF